MKRNGKFYSRNEKETLKKLGLTPAPMSGAGWIVKEDGENEKYMVQLKSTDAFSYRIDLLDVEKLEYHADVSNKEPVFLVQFLKKNKIYALVNVESIFNVEKVSNTKKVIMEDNNESIERKSIKTSKKSREMFFKKRDEQFEQRKQRRRSC